MTAPNRCEWCKAVGHKILRCTNRATKDVTVSSEVLHLCIYHANTVKGMVERKARYEQLLVALREEQENVLRALDELRRKGQL